MIGWMRRLGGKKEDWVGRKKTFINIFVLVCKFMSNKCIQNIFNAFL